MESAEKTDVLSATRQWLTPLAQVLIRSGITWREFSELSKVVFVDVAMNQPGRRRRPNNVSGAAVLTGLSRRDVRKLRERIQTGPPALKSSVTKASQVLSAWHLDPEFLDAGGKPKLLPLKGEGATFATLLERCGTADVPLTTVLKELRSAGAVRKRADGKLEVLKREYVPHAMAKLLIRLWGTVLSDVGKTYAHNLTRSPKAPPRFQRSAVNDRVLVNALPAFEQYLNQEGQAFLERLDAWLTAHQSAGGGGDAQATIRLGAGVYHIQD
jgi:hypothetical protein